MVIKVFLASDHLILVDSLQVLIEAQRDIKVTGTATDGYEAVKRAGKLRPNVAILDIGLPKLNGIEATSQICSLAPSTRVIILAMNASPEYIHRALQAGAKGYLPKEASGTEVINAIRVVAEGQHHLSQTIAATIVEDYVNGNRPIGPLESLSPRERQVLQLVVEGKSSTQVANVLALSPKTVETYRSRIMQKLDIRNLPGLVKFAIQQGITSLE
jgi:DNA-binding NarL/FixJ family response regulator